MSIRGDNALKLALSEWGRPVHSSKDAGKARIAYYIRDPEALAWGWIKDEKLDEFNWCGAFAAAAYPGIKKPLRVEHFASTPRLDNWAKGTARAIEPTPDQVQPGDIILVGPQRGWKAESGKTYKHGRHIAIVESVDAAAGLVHTIEGNTIGEIGNGKRRHGVAKDTRNFYQPGMPAKEWRIVAVIRPIEEDYITPLAVTPATVGAGVFAKLKSTPVLVGLGILGAVGAALWLRYSRSTKGKRRRGRKR